MKTILTAAIAALAIAAGVAGTTTSANAGGYGYYGGGYGYHYAPKCRYINKYDYYGYYVRTIKVCDYY
jgi:hypothetical protein